MNKRLLLFFAIVFVILMAYNHFFIKPYVKEQQRQALQKKVEQAKKSSAEKKAEKITPQQPGSEKPATEQPESEQPESEHIASQQPAEIELPDSIIEETEEKITTIYTDTLTVSFSNKGAIIKSIKLPTYQDEFKTALEMIPKYSKMKSYPFSVSFEDPEATTLENNALYKIKESTVQDKSRGKIKTVTFTYNDAKGNFFEKVFSLSNSYIINFKGNFYYAQKQLNPTVSWTPGLQSITAKQKKESGWGYKEAQGIGWVNNSRVKVAIKKIKATKFTLSDVQWAGIHNNFFLAAFIPGSKSNEITFSYPSFEVTPEITDNLIVSSLQNNKPGSIDFSFYIGPKDPEILSPLGQNLIEAIDYGFFGFIAKALLGALKFLYKYLGNYGLAIIILTIFIRILFYPLTYKSMQSMEKMRQLQPQMQAIKEKYKKIPFNDPRKQKMNQEVMELYKKHGVSPASGCLPLLLQLPVLWGFYSLLSVSIEIRGQAFFLWLQDLSRPDPYYITPIIMGVTMLWQQKITPTAADPMQQRLMLMMPIFFTFIFLNAQSGLVLYWLFNNIFSIIQQQYLASKSQTDTKQAAKKNKK